MAQTLSIYSLNGPSSSGTRGGQSLLLAVISPRGTLVHRRNAEDPDFLGSDRILVDPRLVEVQSMDVSQTIQPTTELLVDRNADVIMLMTVEIAIGVLMVDVISKTVAQSTIDATSRVSQVITDTQIAEVKLWQRMTDNKRTTSSAKKTYLSQDGMPCEIRFHQTIL